MRVLVTGHRGYIGSVLVGVMRHSGFDVYGLDIDLYAGCDFGRVRDDVPGFPFDVNELEAADLASFDAVVHLAWRPDDVASDPADAPDSNADITARLAAMCRDARVSRFVFVSTWEVYGRSCGAVCDERAEVDSAQSAVAEKHQAERRVLSLNSDTFRPVVLRAGECFGVSPRLRLDTLVNRWTAQAVTAGVVDVSGDGAQYLPLIHVEDFSRACAAIVAAPDESLADSLLNVAAPDYSLRLCDIADAVAETTNTVRRLHEYDDRVASADARLDVGRLLRALPRFRFRWPLERGIAQLRDAMTHAGLAPSDLRSDRFDRRLRYLVATEAAREDRLLSRAPREPAPAAS
jgi:nucleoside-diphosphate-sugar epimerase